MTLTMWKLNRKFFSGKFDFLVRDFKYIQNLNVNCKLNR